MVDEGKRSPRTLERLRAVERPVQAGQQLAAANAALRESEERLRWRAEEVETLMDLVPAGIWVAHDPHCDQITGNQTANNLYETYEQENVSANVSSRRRFFRNGQELKPEELPMQVAAAKFHLGALNGRVKSDTEALGIAAQVKDLLGNAIDKSRSLSRELSSPALFQGDLCGAFKSLAQQMQAKHGLAVRLDLCEQVELASEPLRVVLYRAAQELLFNVVKYAGVREARLRLRRRRGRICLSVSDQGRGFDPQGLGKAGGFGLLSIRERVDLLGGRMKIRSALGKGSIFLLTVPDAKAGEFSLPGGTPSAPGAGK